jgi:hypothetical protein
LGRRLKMWVECRRYLGVHRDAPESAMPHLHDRPVPCRGVRPRRDACLQEIRVAHSAALESSAVAESSASVRELASAERKAELLALQREMSPTPQGARRWECANECWPLDVRRARRALPAPRALRRSERSQRARPGAVPKRAELKEMKSVDAREAADADRSARQRAVRLQGLLQRPEAPAVSLRATLRVLQEQPSQRALQVEMPERAEARQRVSPRAVLSRR